MQGSASREAWQWFIDRYRGFVTAALRRMIWSPDRAVDASEEFWGYLFQSGAVARLERQIRFRGFLVSTLRNYARDWLRRNPRVVHDGQAAPPQSASTIAASLGCTANALHQLLFRARARLRECVVEEVRQTVSTRSDLESELDVLLAALGQATPGLVARPVSEQP